MDRVAFVFSGQGDQHPGMGKDLYDRFDAARKVFDLCENLRPGTLNQCFSGSDEELRETKNTQPCLFAMELAAARVLMERGIRPVALAGFSLGEMTAATVAGVFDDETGFRLVCRRGELMQQQAETQDTAMAAVLRLSGDAVTELCKDFDGIYPVNFNCPGNVTVSGLSPAMPAFSAAVKAAGGRALPLKVRGGFHAPFMAAAAEAFAAELSAAKVCSPVIPLYSNVTGLPYSEPAKALLARQICSPVRWEDTIRNMIAAGVDTFIEIGPGATLTNMIKRIDPNVTALTVAEVLKEETQC